MNPAAGRPEPQPGGTPSPPQPPTPGAPTPAGRRIPWPFLTAYYGLAVAWGARNVRYWEESRLDLWVPLLLAVTLGWWAIVDARRRGHPIPLLARPWFFLLAGFLVPGYVVWSRRWRGLGWVVLHAVCWYGLATVAMHVGGTIVFGGEWWRAME